MAMHSEKPSMVSIDVTPLAVFNSVVDTSPNQKRRSENETLLVMYFRARRIQRVR